MKKNSKLLIVIISLLLIVGCGNMALTPTKKVEAFFSKYQKQDKTVMDQLNDVLEDAGLLDDNQKEEYKKLILKQYENISYKIKNEKIDGDNARVEVEIEVYNYGKAIDDAEAYLVNNREEFITVNDTVDSKKFLDYKITKMKAVKDKIKYTVYFTLTKDNEDWIIDDISDVDRQKIHGLFY